MKKLFLALSVLAMLIFAAVPSQALVSMPDAVPGQDILLPFFLCTIDAGESTLLIVQEVNGAATTLDMNVWDQDSVSRHDDTVSLTGNAVEAWNVRTWCEGASVTDIDYLKVDMSGDGVNDHYAGYVTLVNTDTVDANDLVAYIYQIDLANGIASAALAVAEEYERTPQVLTDGMVDASYVELFNADALAAAQMRIASIDPSAVTTLSFAMYPRYYIYDSASTTKNYLFSWRDTTGDATSHIDFYDTDEVAKSGNVTLTHEMDILNAANILPSAHLASYPAAGWIKFKVPDKNASTLTPGDQWIMYNYQKVATGTVGSNWNVLFPVHRAASTTSAAY